MVIACTHIGAFTPLMNAFRNQPLANSLNICPEGYLDGISTYFKP